MDRSGFNKPNILLKPPAKYFYEYLKIQDVKDITIVKILLCFVFTFLFSSRRFYFDQTP